MDKKNPTPPLTELFVYSVSLRGNQEVWCKVGTAATSPDGEEIEITLAPHIRKVGGRIVITKRNLKQRFDQVDIAPNDYKPAPPRLVIKNE